MPPVHVTRVLAVLAVIVPAELPDKTFIASLVLGSRMRPLAVWCGVAAAFAVHVAIAVAAGRALDLLPHRVVEAVVAALFVGGAALMLFGREEQEEVAAERATQRAVRSPRAEAWSAAWRSFVVIFVAEWGDLTQVATANMSATYHDPWSVAVGAVVGLWLVGAIGVTTGTNLLRRVPLTLVRRVGGLIFLVLGVTSAVAASR